MLSLLHLRRDHNVVFFGGIILLVHAHAPEGVAAGFAAVVYGHSHVAKSEMRNGVLYFNPGSAGPRRFSLPISVGKLEISATGIQGSVHLLEVR